QLIRTVAGHVGEVGGAFTMPPTWQFVAQYIERARGRQVGTCDYCCAAQILVDAFPDRPDRELVQTWLGAVRTCGALFAHDEWRGALLAIASLLHERGVLWSRDINAIAARYALREAREEVLAKVDKSPVRY